MCLEFAENNPSIERFVSTYCEYPTPVQVFGFHSNVFLTLDTYERLPDIKAPTLVITGSKDLIIPFENSKLLAYRIPDAELVMIENAGHGLFISDPTDKAVNIVLGFLQRHSKSRVDN
ncbi:MAG: alpha/beta hydrolase [Chloroflexi bacterium]|jgi:pimeloyl-ACP methyl ester carboxylesterase|nr:alpha/beta hydrolase [Chloroflexota bacterium]